MAFSSAGVQGASERHGIFQIMHEMCRCIIDA
jgi:hypothetical protein